jgi:hypothetical protein
MKRARISTRTARAWDASSTSVTKPSMTPSTALRTAPDTDVAASTTAAALILDSSGTAVPAVRRLTLSSWPMTSTACVAWAARHGEWSVREEEETVVLCC